VCFCGNFVDFPGFVGFVRNFGFSGKFDAICGVFWVFGIRLWLCVLTFEVFSVFAWWVVLCYWFADYCSML